MTPPISIKRRLLRWLGYSFLCITLLAIVTIYFFISRGINQYFDERLMNESNNIIDRLYVHDSKIKFKQENRGINLQTTLGDSSVFYSIVDASGSLIAGFENIPHPIMKNDYNHIYYDAKFFNQKIRAFSMIHTMIRNKKSYTVTITIAETLEDRNAILYKLYAILTIITALILISTLFFTLLAVNKGLSPLVGLQYSFRRRNIHDLTPIKENKTPIEVIALVQSINKLFARLKKSFLHVEQFNEDISHQLRTPLAELKIMIETDESIDERQRGQYLESIETMVHTTEQLLLRAYTNPDAYDRVKLRPLNLTELCKKIALHKAPILYENGFDLSFEAKGNSWIKGSDVVIESLLNNLIDNTKKYALNKLPTEQSMLILRIKEDDTHVTMSILDNGPGIPSEYLEKIFDRFFRLDTQQKGTGLGLNIVKQIVELHSASIKLKNRKPHGLNVSITFPKVDPPLNITS